MVETFTPHYFVCLGMEGNCHAIVKFVCPIHGFIRNLTSSGSLDIKLVYYKYNFILNFGKIRRRYGLTLSDYPSSVNIIVDKIQSLANESACCLI